jgi:hypothetical protein
LVGHAESSFTTVCELQITAANNAAKIAAAVFWRCISHEGEAGEERLQWALQRLIKQNMHVLVRVSIVCCWPMSSRATAGAGCQSKVASY